MAASIVMSFFGGSRRVLGLLSRSIFQGGSLNSTTVCNQQRALLTPSTLQVRKTDPLPAPSNFISPLSVSTSLAFTCIRTMVRYSRRKGQPKTVKAIVSRFYRLDWGIYIRTRAGRHKKKWKKPDWIIERGKYHVFCNKQQSRMFDKMVTKEWKRKRHYLDDPYERYNRRFGMKEEVAPKFLP